MKIAGGYEMIIGVDIDQTIGTGHKGQSVQESIAYYQSKGLVIPQTVQGYLELFQLPTVLPLHEVFPGAVVGVKTLARYGSIRYYTVRKHPDRQREEEIQALTKVWLAEWGFPSADQVVFCRSVMQKLVYLYDEEKDHADRLLLIDDRWQKAIEAVSIIAQHEDYRPVAEFLRAHLTLVAFGASSRPDDTEGLHVVAFSDWTRIADLLPYLEELRKG